MAYNFNSGTGAYRTRRQVGSADEIQLNIDADLDEDISGLSNQVRQLRNVAQDIEIEVKSQNDLISQLQMTVFQAQAGVKNNMRRLNKSIVKEGANHIMHVVLFALVLFFIIYFISKLA